MSLTFKGYKYSAEKPIKLGASLEIPKGSKISASKVADGQLMIEIPIGKDSYGRLNLQSGTSQVIEDQIAYDTGKETTTPTITGGVDSKDVVVELEGKFFFDQKNGALMLVRVDTTKPSLLCNPLWLPSSKSSRATLPMKARLLCSKG